MEHISPECNCDGKQCPSCKKIRCIAYYKRRRGNPEIPNKRCHFCYDNTQLWRDKHPEVVARNNVKMAENRRISAKKWNAAHPEQARAHKQKWEIKNPGRKNELFRIWGKNHPEKMRLYDRKNKQRRKELLEQSSEHYTQQEWEDLKDKYGYRCLCCGRQEPEIKLVTDHVIPVSKGGGDAIDNIQPLCGSCNSHKRVQSIDYRQRS